MTATPRTGPGPFDDDTPPTPEHVGRMPGRGAWTDAAIREAMIAERGDDGKLSEMSDLSA